MRKILRFSVIISLTIAFQNKLLTVKAYTSSAIIVVESINYDLSKIEDAKILFTLYPDLLTSTKTEAYDYDYPLMVSQKISTPNLYSSVIIDEGSGPCYGSVTSFNLSVCVKANYSNVSLEYSRLFNQCLNPYTDNALGCSSYAIFGAGMYFAKRVRSGGVWDYKLLCSSYSTKVNIKINNTYYSIQAQDIGNIHYGYVGSALFSASILKSFAGLASILDNQVYWSWVSTYFDNPTDQNAIQRGINWRNNGYFY
jgi:hypothetical protein